jgi:ribosomal protein L32
MKAADDLRWVRIQLTQQGQLEAHTLFACPRCGEQRLGRRRCPDCHVFSTALGLGAVCADCGTPVLLRDLFLEEGQPLASA